MKIFFYQRVSSDFLVYEKFSKGYQEVFDFMVNDLYQLIPDKNYLESFSDIPDVLALNAIKSNVAPIVRYSVIEV